MPAIEELTDAYERYVLGNEDGFMDEFRDRLADFGGRPTPLQRADRLSSATTARCSSNARTSSTAARTS